MEITMKKQKYLTKLYLIICATICSVQSIFSQLGEATGTVTYYDVDLQAQKPVVNAKIVVQTYYPAGTYETYTDGSGNFYVSFPSGVYPSQAVAYLFFKNDKIDLRGYQTTRSTFVNKVHAGSLGPSGGPFPPCSFSFNGYFEDLNFIFSISEDNNNYAKIFMMANEAANFAIQSGYTPPQCIVKYPLEESIVHLQGVWYDMPDQDASFFWPFGTMSISPSDLLLYIPIIPIICPDCGAQLTSNTVYINRKSANAGGRFTVFHEYGHFVMKMKRGGTWPISATDYTLGIENPNHSFNDYNQTSRKSYIEGWADFYGSSVESYYVNPANPYSGRLYDQFTNGSVYTFNDFFESPSDYNSSHWYYEKFNFDNVTNGYVNEVTVAAAFFDFYDQTTFDDNFQTSFLNILNTIGDGSSTMPGFISTLAHKPFLTDQTRNSGIPIMEQLNMDPVVSYGNATLKVKNDFNGGNVNIDSVEVNTDQQPTPGIFEKTELWMKDKRLQAEEQFYPGTGYQYVFQHTRPVNFSNTWTTIEFPQSKNNFTEIWNTFTDQVTFRANFDKLCNITVSYQSIEGGVLSGGENNTYRSGTSIAISAPMQIVQNGITYNFLQWNDGSTNPTRNEIINEHKNYTAQYKAHLASTTSAATASNAQHKIVHLEDGRLLTVYESGDLIFSSISEDGGETWNQEFIFAEESGNLGSAKFRSPSICMVNNIAYQAFEIYDENSHCVLVYKFNGENWDYVTTVDDCYESNESFQATPVIAGGKFGPGKSVVLCVWKNPEELKIAGFSFEGYTSSKNSVTTVTIPTTTSHSTSPTLAVESYPDGLPFLIQFPSSQKVLI
jgi:hypothetical protein